MAIATWKTYANKHFHGMKIKESPKCIYCEEESQSLKHLFVECKSSRQLFACFEKSFLSGSKLTDLEKLIGADPGISRSKLIKKKLSILRRMIYQCNHKDEKPRWGNFLELLDRVYVAEYAIADRNGRILQHFKCWEK